MSTDDSWGHLRRRPLSGREETLWYVVAGVTYVGASLFHKGLLNWLIGPLWLVAVVTLGPLAAERLRRHRA